MGRLKMKSSPLFITKKYFTLGSFFIYLNESKLVILCVYLSGYIVNLFLQRSKYGMRNSYTKMGIKIMSRSFVNKWLWITTQKHIQWSQNNIIQLYKQDFIAHLDPTRNTMDSFSSYNCYKYYAYKCYRLSKKTYTVYMNLK